MSSTSMSANCPARSIEMNVIIIAACIPTLRPVFLVLWKCPGTENFRASVRERGHPSYHYRTADLNDSQRTRIGSGANSKPFEQRASQEMTGSTEAINNKSAFDGGILVQVESRELGSRDQDVEEEEWGHAKGSGVPMTNMWGNGRGGHEDSGSLTIDSAV